MPNVLTLVRLSIGILFVWLPVTWRGPAVVVGAVTDLFDGLLSRHFGMASRAGRVLDPIADKAFLAGIVTALLLDGILRWEEFVLVAARDLVVVLGATIALATRDWPAFHQHAPTAIGKLTTAAQFVFLAVLILAPEYQRWLFLPTAVLSVGAGLHYFWLFVTHRR